MAEEHGLCLSHSESLCARRFVSAPHCDPNAFQEIRSILRVTEARVCALAVELRTINSGSMAISGTHSSCSSIRFNKVRAAISPIFWSGWRTVVRLGLLCTAILMSSKPTTETSSGTRNPASWKARMEPIAEISL